MEANEGAGPAPLRITKCRQIATGLDGERDIGVEATDISS